MTGHLPTRRDITAARCLRCSASNGPTHVVNNASCRGFGPECKNRAAVDEVRGIKEADTQEDACMAQDERP